MGSLRVQNLSEARTVILVIGMHRSGTSFAASVLHSVGLSLGGEPIRTDSANELGYFETREFVSVNRLLLREAGGDWDDPQEPGRLSWRAQFRVRELAAKLAASPATGFVLKDPRATFTVPVWERVLGAVPLVCCFRHPLAVAGSLQARHSLSIEKGLELWRRYNQQMLDCTRGRKHVLFDFDRVSESAPRFDRILVEAGIPVDETRISAVVEKRFQRRLQHHGASEESLPEAVCSLYRELRERYRTG